MFYKSIVFKIFDQRNRFLIIAIQQNGIDFTLIQFFG